MDYFFSQLIQKWKDFLLRVYLHTIFQVTSKVDDKWWGLQKLEMDSLHRTLRQTER